MGLVRQFKHYHAELTTEGGGMTMVQHQVHFRHGRRSRKTLALGKAKPKPVGRVPRVAKLMALAIRFDQMIKDGVVTDQTELARLGHVSRA